MTEWWDSFSLTEAEFPQIQILDSATSTNEVVRESDLGASEYGVTITPHQTQGRGRLGRRWISRSGESLAMSVLVPQLSEPHKPWLPLVVGGSLTRSLRCAGLGKAEMKWPNDVLVRGQKLAGVLCESLPSDRVVVGVGLNVDFGLKGGPAPRAVDLARYLPISASLVDGIVHGALARLRAWCEVRPDKAIPSARQIVEPVLATLGRLVTVHEPGGRSWSGYAQELSDEGHLLVETAWGHLSPVVASDIEHLRQ